MLSQPEPGLVQFVTQDRSRHLQDADDVRPIVRSGDLDPAGQLTAANGYEVAKVLPMAQAQRVRRLGRSVQQDAG